MSSYCSIKDCLNKHYKQQLCRQHYKEKHANDSSKNTEKNDKKALPDEHIQWLEQLFYDENNADFFCENCGDFIEKNNILQNIAYIFDVRKFPKFQFEEENLLILGKKCGCKTKYNNEHLREEMFINAKIAEKIKLLIKK